jgi:dienelactone hydrolase
MLFPYTRPRLLLVESSSFIIKIVRVVFLLAAASLSNHHLYCCCQAASFVLPPQRPAEQRSLLSFGTRRILPGQTHYQQHIQRQGKTTISISPLLSSPTRTISDDDDSSSSTWVSLDPESLVSAKCLIEQTLCQATTITTTITSENNNNDEEMVVIMPRLAKDVDYATAILDAWRQDEQDDFDETKMPWKAVWKPRNVIYEDSTGTSKLYGHLIGRIPDDDARSNGKEDDDKNMQNTMIPGIILFHTGAGPHDLFLLWKAAATVNQLYNNNNNNNDDNNSINNNNNNNNGCLVLIADMLSDESGWAWEEHDKTRYNEARDFILKPNKDDLVGQQRPVLRQRIHAAIDTLLQSKLTSRSGGGGGGSNDGDDIVVWTVDPNRIAALGWCLGGHAIMELADMSRQLHDVQEGTACSIRALATFHGVFDTGVSLSSSSSSLPISGNHEESLQQRQPDEPLLPTPTFRTEVLICHGTKDPFVSDESLERALACLQQQSHITTSLLQLQGARHGFTNPAQDFNANQQAFGYHHGAATKAWKQVMNVLRRNLLLQ